MKQHNPITDTLRRVCQRAEAATADAVAELRGQVGAGLVAVADLGLLDGARSDGSCEILGNRPVPPFLSPDANLCGIIFGGAGRMLWLGRNRWLGNDAQWLATAGSIYVL